MADYSIFERKVSYLEPPLIMAYFYNRQYGYI